MSSREKRFKASDLFMRKAPFEIKIAEEERAVKKRIKRNISE